MCEFTKQFFVSFLALERQSISEFQLEKYDMKSIVFHYGQEKDYKVLKRKVKVIEKCLEQFIQPNSQNVFIELFRIFV